jgi:hypothetical protein
MGSRWRASSSIASFLASGDALQLHGRRQRAARALALGACRDRQPPPPPVLFLTPSSEFPNCKDRCRRLLRCPLAHALRIPVTKWMPVVPDSSAREPFFGCAEALGWEQQPAKSRVEGTEPESKYSTGRHACECACVCVCGGGGGKVQPRTVQLEASRLKSTGCCGFSVRELLLRFANPSPQRMHGPQLLS